ncbi:hypothetical protein BST61_g7591 [Cercospora zeina]
MSRSSRIFCYFILISTLPLLFLQLLKPSNNLHKLSIDDLKAYAPSTTSLTYHNPWTSSFRRLSSARKGKNPSRIGTVTVAHGSHHKEAYTIAFRTHLAYAKLQAYPTHRLTHSILPGLWIKESHLLSVLLSELSQPDPSKRLHWLVWFDADTIIMNPPPHPAPIVPPTRRPRRKGASPTKSKCSTRATGTA